MHAAAAAAAAAAVTAAAKVVVAAAAASGQQHSIWSRNRGGQTICTSIDIRRGDMSTIFYTPEYIYMASPLLVDHGAAAVLLLLLCCC